MMEAETMNEVICLYSRDSCNGTPDEMIVKSEENLHIKRSSLSVDDNNISN